MKNYDKFDAWMFCGAPERTFGDETEYPIAGCREVISRLIAETRALEPETVLCVGPGSESAATALYGDGCDVWIADRNMEKLKFLSSQMPKAHFLHCDIFDVMPDIAYEQQFDAIVCTYTMHTAGSEERLWAIEDFTAILSEEGRVIIGDVCFWTTAEREICRRRCRENWDNEANYIVYDEFRKLFDEHSIKFIRISHCAGIIILSDLVYDESEI